MAADVRNDVDSGSEDAVAAVLEGARSYDTLDSGDQSVVLALWAERIDALLESLDPRAEFEASGVTYAALGDGEDVVVHRPPS